MTQVIISGDAVESNNPVIGYRNLLASGTVTASSEAAGFEKENAFDNVATDYWKPAVTGENWIQATVLISESVDYVGIARHTLGTDNATCVMQYHNGVAWVDSSPPFSPTDDEIILVLFTAQSSTQHRLKYTSAGTPRIGAISFGPKLQLERGIFSGHIPERLNRDVTRYGGRTDVGAFLPNNIIREATSSRIEQTYLSRAFSIAEIEPLMRYQEKGNPFFWAWQPVEYPTHVIWARATDTPSCTPMQPGNFDDKGFWQYSCGIRGVLR